MSSVLSMLTFRWFNAELRLGKIHGSRYVFHLGVRECRSWNGED